MSILSFIDGRLGKLDQWYFHCHRFANRRSPALFHRGWGNTEALTAINAHWRAPTPPSPMEITWETAWAESKKGMQYRRGSFPTPAYKQYLPLASARAYCHFVRPSRHSPSQEKEPVVVLMPTTREVGVASRMPLAYALAKQGISSLLLESPFMGRRKSDEQHGTTLSYLSDFLLLAAASVEEGRAALGWLSAQGYDKLCCAGISQGGYLATVAGLRSPIPSHVVALLAPHSGAAALVDGLLGQLCDWDLLQTTSGSNIPVREQMHNLFALTSLELLTPLPPPLRLTLIGARQDRYVPAASYQKMQALWQNKATIQWLAGGHVSSIAERRHIRNAILATFSDA